MSPNTATTLTATSGANQSATVNTAFTTKLVATATDAWGNAVSGVAVTFAAPSSGASATFAACNSNPQTYSCTQTTGATGQATSSTFTANGTNGTYNITASAPGLTSVTYAETNKGNQTITFTSTNPSPVTVGGASYTPTATATSGLAVAFTLDGTSTGCTLTAGVVNFTAAGTCVVDANQGGNGTWNAAPQVQQSITVNKRNQTITFTSTNPSPVTVGGASYTPTATATSGLAVAFTLDGTSTGCTLTAGVVNFTAAGTCVVDANQGGNGTWNAAPQVQQSITVNKRNQTITFTSTNPSPVTVGGASYTPTATATSGLAVAFTLDGTSTGCTLTAGVVNFTAAGTCVVDANQGGNGTWNAAPQVQQSITVNKGNQTITFTSTAPANATVGGASYTPTATATSGLAVAFTLDGTSTGCTLTAGVVNFTAAGTCVVDANQGGNGNWNAAPQAQQSFAVKRNQTITFTSTNPSPVTVGGASYTPTATATSGLAVAFTLDGTSTGCTLTAGVVNFTAAGTCVVDANQGGNGTWNAAPQVQQSITVNKRNQTITFTSTNPSPVTVGGASYTPTATATSGLAVAFTLDGTSTGCTLTAGVVNFTAGGTCVVDANQGGNGTWNAAPQVQQSITVNKRNQTITFTSTPPTSNPVGGASYTPTATATSGLAVAFTLDGTSTGCTLTAGVVNFTAAGTCVVDANQGGNGTWNAAPQVQQSFSVGLTITSDQYSGYWHPR